MNNENDISSLRTPIDPPKNLVDANGQAIFGTFNKEIVNINLLDCYRPTGKKISKLVQDMKLTRWEATEIVTKEHAIVTAVYGMGKLGFAIIVLWDRANNKITSYIKFSNGKKICICDNLIDSETKLCTKKVSVHTENDMPNGKARTYGEATSSKKPNINFDVNLSRLSPPSVVSIPFGKNMPLYSQKDFFKADGFIEFDNKRYETDEDSVAIIDDHKGYYPRRAHYDWLTTMGRIEHNGKKIYIALNLTKNQSINEKDYNENLVWLENESYPLSPITFEKGEKTWHVYDENKKLDITFDIQNIFDIIANLGALKVEYYLPVGSIKGYVIVNDEKYILDNMIGIAEDKSTLL